MKVLAVGVMVLVQDLDRSVEFYKNVLRLTLVDEMSDWALFQEGVMLQLNPYPDTAIQYDSSTVVMSLVVEDFALACKHLEEHEADFISRPEPGSTEQAAIICDVDGNVIQISSVS